MARTKRPFTELVEFARALRIAERDVDRAFVEEAPDHTIGEAMGRRQAAIDGICQWVADNDGPLPPVEE